MPTNVNNRIFQNSFFQEIVKLSRPGGSFLSLLPHKQKATGSFHRAVTKHLLLLYTPFLLKTPPH